MHSTFVLFAALAGSAIARPMDVSIDTRGITGGGIASAAALDISSVFSSVLGGGEESSTTILSGLSSQGAAALEGGALGCSAGTIEESARDELKGWLSSQSAVHFDSSLKTSLVSWCEGESSAVLSSESVAALSVFIPTCADIAAKDQFYVTSEGIFSASKLESVLVLSSSAQSSITEFISSSSSELSKEVKAGLGVCAAGGTVSSLSSEIKSSLVSWVSSSECELSSSLKTSVISWAQGQQGGDVVQLGSLSQTALTAVSVGSSVVSHVEQGGVLSSSGQASISAFLESSIASGIEENAKSGLESCAQGALASSLSIESRTALVTWVSSSSCSLGPELKSVVFYWLSFAIVEEKSVNIESSELSEVSSFLTETVISSLSVELRSSLSLCAAGESVSELSYESRSEFAAFLGGSTGINIGSSVEAVITEWFTGCSLSGAPSSGASPAPAPAPAPAASAPEAPGAPSGPSETSVPAGPPAAAPPAPASPPAAESSGCECE